MNRSKKKNTIYKVEMNSNKYVHVVNTCMFISKSSIYAILTAVSIMVNIVVIVVSIDMVVLCAVFY